tara:strand:- start:128 stop:760 length:633 start_codon:yes stop_codon:yes gene_type:complete
MKLNSLPEIILNLIYTYLKKNTISVIRCLSHSFHSDKDLSKIYKLMVQYDTYAKPIIFQSNLTNYCYQNVEKYEYDDINDLFLPIKTLRNIYMIVNSDLSSKRINFMNDETLFVMHKSGNIKTLPSKSGTVQILKDSVLLTITNSSCFFNKNFKKILKSVEYSTGGFFDKKCLSSQYNNMQLFDLLSNFYQCRDLDKLFYDNLLKFCEII